MSVKVRKFKRGGYEVDIIVRLPDGTRLRERKKTPCSSKPAAQRWGEERQAILVLSGKPRRKEVPTLEAFVPRYMAEHVRANRHKPSTQSLKQHIIDFYLKPRWAKWRLDEIRDCDVQKLKADLAELSPKTVNNVLCVLNTMFKVALEWGVIDAMPTRVKLLKVSPSDVPFYEPHDYERLVEAARSIGDHRLLVFVLLGGDAGLRCGEIIALEQTDVDLKRGVLNVRQSEWEGHLSLPKSGRGRRVVLTERLAAALAKNRHLHGARVLWREESEGKVTQVLLAKWMRRLQAQGGAQGDRTAAHPPAHLLLALGDGRCIDDGDQGARRPPADLHHAALHAPLACSEGERHPAARSRCRSGRRGPEGHGKPWRHCGDGKPRLRRIRMISCS